MQEPTPTGARKVVRLTLRTTARKNGRKAGDAMKARAFARRLWPTPPKAGAA